MPSKPTRLPLLLLATLGVACGSSNSSSSSSSASGATSGSSRTAGSSGASSSGASSSGASTSRGASASSSSGSPGLGSSGSSGSVTPSAGNTVTGTLAFPVLVAEVTSTVLADGEGLPDGGTLPGYSLTAFLSGDPEATICGAGNLLENIQLIATHVGSPVVPGHYQGQLQEENYAMATLTVALPDGGYFATTTAGDSDFSIDVTEADDAGFAGTYSGSSFPDGGPFFLSGTFLATPCP